MTKHEAAQSKTWAEMPAGTGTSARRFLTNRSGAMELGATSMEIRAEREADHDAVRQIVAAEFDTGTEADFVDRLRSNAGAKQPESPVVSLVADDSGQVVGHILLSPVPLEENRSAKLTGLVSLAVVPERQGEGIGSALMRAGLDRCRALGFDGVVALGHADYYQRFGFSPAAGFGLHVRYRVPDDAFLALELKPHALEGKAGTVNHLEGLR
jgi:putative acetyltransferase